MSAADKRQEIVNWIKISEQCERYDDMVKYVKKLIELTTDLTPEEVNLFTLAYKNQTSSRRTAWRAITTFQMKEQSKNSHYLETVQIYKRKIQKELLDLCEQVIQTIDSKLIVRVTKAQSRIGLLKSKADHLRYICEFTKTDKQKQNQSRLTKTLTGAQSCYNEAIQIADKEGIPKTSPVRLGVILNLSVLLYQIGNDSKKAIEICQKGFNEASNLLNDIEMDEYKDTTTIMQVMYDNLTNWKNDEEK